MHVIHFYCLIAHLEKQFIRPNFLGTAERVTEVSLYLYLAGGGCDAWSQRARPSKLFALLHSILGMKPRILQANGAVTPVIPHATPY